MYKFLFSLVLFACYLQMPVSQASEEYAEHARIEYLSVISNGQKNVVSQDEVTIVSGDSIVTNNSSPDAPFGFLRAVYFMPNKIVGAE
jgi:hypothetical protein